MGTVVTTLEFLDRCHAEIAWMYRYWDGKRRGRPMPARQDIEPLEFPRLLPGTLLVDVVADPRCYVDRLVGTREALARGEDPTGKPVAETFFGLSRENVLANYDHALEHRSFLYDDDRFQAPGGRYSVEESLFLPLSSDGERLNMIMVYTHHKYGSAARTTRTSPFAPGA